MWRKLWDPRSERHPRNHTLRRVGQAVSDDFINWTDYRPVLGADDADPLNRDQFYNMEVLVYDGLRLGLMTVFSYDPEYCRGAVQFTYSRDGRHWQRAGDRQVLLPLSEKPGDFDWGSIYPLQGPLVVGDEIWIYYTGFGVDHNHSRPPGVSGSPNGIGLARLRLDGFLSLEAGSAEGSLTTKSFTFKGERLMINAAAPRGRVQVEILGGDGLPVKRFGKAECLMQRFDRTRQPHRLLRAPGNHSLDRRQRGGGDPSGRQPEPELRGSFRTDQPGRRKDLGGRDPVGDVSDEPIHPVRAGSQASRPLLHRPHPGTVPGPLPDPLSPREHRRRHGNAWERGRPARAPRKPSSHDIVTPRAQNCRSILVPLVVEGGPSVFVSIRGSSSLMIGRFSSNDPHGRTGARLNA